MTTYNASLKSHWTELQQAVRLIAAYRNALKTANNSPQYIGGAWCEQYGDYEPVENLGPWDDLENAKAKVLQNQRANAMARALRLRL